MVSVKCKVENVKAYKEGAIKCHVRISGKGSPTAILHFTLCTLHSNCDPPETIQLLVGDFSIAVTNAGDYTFLLEKGVEYEYGTVPFLSNVTYSAVDDVPLIRGGLRSLRTNGTLGETRSWTVDGGYQIEPQTADSPGRFCWLPIFFGYPDMTHIGLDNNPMTFGATICDYVGNDVVQYSWTASDGLAVGSPNSQTTQIYVENMPSWANSNEVSAAKIAQAGWSFSSDAPTSGVVRVSCVANADKVALSDFVGEWSVDDDQAIVGTDGTSGFHKYNTQHE